MGVPPDYGEAIRWYRQAADRGNAAAMNNIGWLYQHGRGVPQDYGEAMRWANFATPNWRSRFGTRRHPNLVGFPRLQRSIFLG